MKRIHVHMGVEKLDTSIAYYSSLFGAEPSVLKSDYAKWDLADPAVNFAITEQSGAPGIRHLGIEAESDDELGDIRERLAAAGETTFDEEAANCCYAVSDKSWSNDPSGVRWEAFHSLGRADGHGEEAVATEVADRCCAPKTAAVGCC